MSNTTALVKTRRVGDSIVITLPRGMVKAKNIREGENIEITVKKLRVDGFGALRGIGPLTPDDQLETHE